MEEFEKYIIEHTKECIDLLEEIKEHTRLGHSVKAHHKLNVLDFKLKLIKDSQGIYLITKYD